MSATNRGAVRTPGDYYGTPAWATKAILNTLLNRGLSFRRVLEPGCGAGAIVSELCDYGWQARNICAVENNPSHVLHMIAEYPGAEIKNADFLKMAWEMPKFPFVIGNPPYNQAEKFVRAALHVANGCPYNGQDTGDGCVVMLLRLNWLASQTRQAFHRNYPAHVHVLPKRPSFGLNKHGKPGTDATEYAWFQWGGPGYVPNKWETLEVGS